jgi:cysteine-rich repeat protein
MRLAFVVAVVGALFLGCGDDGAPVGDAGADATLDGGDGSLPSCEGIGDGASCGEGFICVSGRCGPSRCGDGHVDAERAEACDDGNAINGDGCDDDCTPTCTLDADCDNGDPCNGTETCVSSRCQLGLVPADGSEMCTTTGGGAGVCYGGLCSPPDCGNGTVDPDEDCDDGRNGDNEDGCRDDCTYTCTVDDGCDDGDACNGAETCDGSTNTCVDPADLDCDDSDDCTADSCDAAVGCVNALVDGDGDGYSAASCTTAGLMGGDCDDARSDVYPGATELCDGADNDCNGMVDDGTSDVTCLRDQDGDGYGDATMSMSGCSCPAGYIPPRADGTVDCEDVGAVAASINPGQMAFSPVGYCPSAGACALTDISFDWNCDGVEEQRWMRTNLISCAFGGGMCRGSGWTGGTAPDCGDEAELRTCEVMMGAGGILTCVEDSLGMRTQECR